MLVARLVKQVPRVAARRAAPVSRLGARTFAVDEKIPKDIVFEQEPTGHGGKVEYVAHIPYDADCPYQHGWDYRIMKTFEKVFTRTSQHLMFPEDTVRGRNSPSAKLVRAASRNLLQKV